MLATPSTGEVECYTQLRLTFRCIDCILIRVSIVVFRCDVCPRIFSSLHGLKMHSKTHGDEAEKLACDAQGCDRTFSTSQALSPQVGFHVNGCIDCLFHVAIAC